MTDIEKLRVLLPHWITHNREHGQEFHRWMHACEAEAPEAAKALEAALAAAEGVTANLEKALTILGGPVEETHEQGHHHGHSHHHHHD